MSLHKKEITLNVSICVTNSAPLHMAAAQQTTFPSYISYPSNVESDSSPQGEVYSVWHVCRAMDKASSCAEMGVYANILSVEFRSDLLSRSSYAVRKIPHAMPARVESFCFFACPPLPTSTPFLNDVFKSMRPRLEKLLSTPAESGEFDSNQVLACESLGHEARIKSSVERDPERKAKLIRRAAFMYEAGLRMIGHTTVLAMLNRIARHPEEVYVVRVNDEASTMSSYMRRFISSSFAGLAICSIYENDFARVGGFASLVAGWDDAGGIVLLNTIRVIAMLEGKLEIYFFITRNILMPYVVRTGREAIFEDELRLCIPDDIKDGTRSIVSALAYRFGRGIPDGVHVRTRIIDGQVVERVCAECGLAEGKLRHCAKCKSVYYCGKGCQAKHWPKHRSFCTRASAW